MKTAMLIIGVGLFSLEAQVIAVGALTALWVIYAAGRKLVGALSAQSKAA